MSVNVSKFIKKKEGSTSVVVNNSNKGYSNTTTVGSLDRMLWDIHDTGQDITGTPTLPALNVNGQINAGGKIHSDTEVNAPTGRFSYLYPDYIYECKEGHISYLYSDFIDTDDLKVNNTAEIKNIISEHISTQYLDVTKSAHFAELIIDKIKSVGGSAVFSPADGFKIANEDNIIQIYDSNGNATNYWMLCWDGEDDRGATVNMWERNDQALCQNFNEATTGVSHNVSNTYFWMLVFTAGTYNPENPADIMYDHGTSEDYINQSSYRQETAYNSEGEKITFDTLKHYIVVYNSNSRFTDAERNTEYVRDGSFNPKAGNEVVMLGHRARLDEMYLEEYKKRQSAIYIAAYNSTIEPDLMAPLIAQYQGINDFNLSTHRTTHFAAGHNDIFGYDNVIRGSFKTINGTDITDLNGVTYFIKSNKAYIPVTSDWYIGNNAFNITLECMYISGDNGPAYVGTRNDNMSLRIQYTYNGTTYYKDYTSSQISDPITIDLRDIILPRTNGYIDSLSFLIREGNIVVYQYNIPVIQQSGSNPGDDAEFYKMNPIRELAQVDVEGNFALYLEYEVQHIIGDEITTADNTDYSIQFTIWDENNNREQTKTVPYTSPYFTYDKDGNPAYEKVNVFGTYGSRSLLHDQYIEVKLIKNNGAVEVERRVIPVTLVAGAMFSVTDSITSRVTSSETTANTAYNMASQAVQTAQGFEQRVSKTETDISNQQDTITGMQSDISTIQQTADAITSEVTKISGVGGENLIVNSSFQISEENDMPERWDYYDENTIITINNSSGVNYVNINNNINQPSSGDGKWRGIQQTTQNRLDTAIQDFYPNHIYCFSFYGKKNSTYGEISCFIHYLDSNGTHISRQEAFHDQIYSDFDLNDNWQRYAFIFKTPNENAIFSFNIMLEYYGNIRRNNESSIPLRENDVDIMMPMLLDLGVVTNERMDLYELYRLSGDTHVYNVWKNEDYDVSQVPMWQGNSQDVSISSSQILQTSDLIRGQVGDCGVDITEKKIILNGNTEINGSLNLYDDETGFVLNGAGGITQISPKSVGDYYTDFRQNSETVFNRVETIAGTYTDKSGATAYYNYNIRIYLGKITARKTINFNSMVYRFYNSYNDHIQPLMEQSPVTIQIEEKYNSSTITTSKTFGNFNYTVGSNDADIYLVFNKVVGHNINNMGSVNDTPYCDLTIQYTIPNDAFTLIGYDGIGMNLGTGANVFFGKNEAVLRYGQYGLKITNNNISKIVGLDDNQNEIWGNLNTPKLQVTSNDIGKENNKSKWPENIDMIVTTKALSNVDQVIYLPSDPYTGRTVYIRKRGESKVNVYSTDKIMMKGYSTITSTHMILPGDYMQIGDNGLEFKFTFDGNYWLINYLDGI